MPSTVKEPRRVDGPSGHGEEICHIVTDEDPDTALCGKDVTGWPWNPPWPYCVVCPTSCTARRGAEATGRRGADAGRRGAGRARGRRGARAATREAGAPGSRPLRACPGTR